MKALTIHQPYASLIAVCAKRFETRSWATKYRGRIAIHAGSGSPFKAVRYISREAIASMKLVLRNNGIMPLYGDFRYLPHGAIIATAELVRCDKMWAGGSVGVPGAVCIDRPNQYWSPNWQTETNEFIFGDWTPGRYAWELADVKMLPEPIPVRGRQGLWNWEGADNI